MGKEAGIMYLVAGGRNQGTGDRIKEQGTGGKRAVGKAVRKQEAVSIPVAEQ